MNRTLALVWGHFQGTQPVEDGIALQLGFHQAYLDGEELLQFDEAG